MYGWKQKYVSELHSTVSRLDEMHAAMLRVEAAASRCLEHRSRAAGASLSAGPARVACGPPRDGVFHLFVVQSRERDALKAHLEQHGVGDRYPLPLPAHQQTPYIQFARRSAAKYRTSGA